MEAVSVRALTKVYQPSPRWMRFLVRTNLSQEVVALDRISFDVGRGEILAMVGPNGAGKSTAFRILVGLTSPTSGWARILGTDSASGGAKLRRLIGWMPAEDRSLLLRLSCAENLRFHGRLHGMTTPEVRRRTDQVLEEVGLSDFADATPFALSAGMRARLQLARALFHSPQVLILDEPTGSVDPVAAHDLLALIVDIVQQRRLAALISSHRLEEIEALHSHVILLDRGSIRYDGDLDELRKRYDLARVELACDDPGSADEVARRLRQDPAVEEVTSEGPVVTVTLKPEARIIEVLAGLGDFSGRILHVRDSRTPLRDILASMYREGDQA